MSAICARDHITPTPREWRSQVQCRSSRCNVVFFPATATTAWCFSGLLLTVELIYKVTRAAGFTRTRHATKSCAMFTRRKRSSACRSCSTCLLCKSCLDKHLFESVGLFGKSWFKMSKRTASPPPPGAFTAMLCSLRLSFLSRQ
jgi:hypothetical protein